MRTTALKAIGEIVRAMAIVLSVWCARSARADESAQARDTLMRVMTEEAGWIKVHSAEVLSRYGQQPAVRRVFLAEERRHGTTSAYRIGVWRVLADAATAPDERSEWLGRIEAVFMDPKASDRLHALESLCKLGWIARGPQVMVLQDWCAAASPAEAVFGYWALALAGRHEVIQILRARIADPESLVRIRAAAVLRRMAVREPSVLEALAAATKVEARTFLEQAHVTGAALAANADPRQATIWQTSLERVIQTGTPAEAYVAWQGLLGRVTAAEVARIAPAWSSASGDFAVGAAWAVLAASAGNDRRSR